MVVEILCLGSHTALQVVKKNENKTKHPYGALYANYVQCLFILKLVGK